MQDILQCAAVDGQHIGMRQFGARCCKTKDRAVWKEIERLKGTFAKLTPEWKFVHRDSVRSQHVGLTA